MAIVHSTKQGFSVYVGTVLLRNRPSRLRIDIVEDSTNGLNLFRTIGLETATGVCDTNITSKQDMQFTRELNARGSYVLD